MHDLTITQVIISHVKLENVAIANALQLEAALATPVLFRCNYDARPSLTLVNLSIAYYITYRTTNCFSNG